jgi:WD40 repeat protein
VYKQNISASASKDTTEDEYKQPVSKLFVASASVQHLPAGFPLFVRFNSSKHHRMYLSQPADVHSAQLNTFSGNDGAGEVWAVGDKMVKSCDSLARSCSKGAFGGNGVLQSALCVTFSSAPAFVITGMTHWDVYFWSAASVITKNQAAHQGGVTSVAWLNQMTDKGPVPRLVSGGKDDCLRLWDMSDVLRHLQQPFIPRRRNLSLSYRDFLWPVCLPAALVLALLLSHQMICWPSCRLGTVVKLELLPWSCGRDRVAPW